MDYFPRDSPRTSRPAGQIGDPAAARLFENLQIREVCKPLNRQVLEKLHECPGNTNVMKITEAQGGLPAGWNP
jgi:hypothetical protein